MSNLAKAKLRLGFVLNPLAGMGGPEGLKGSDNLPEAFTAEGFVSRAQARARRCLEQLVDIAPALEFFTGAGMLGADVLDTLGFEYQVLYTTAEAAATRAEDTYLLCRAFQLCPVDLIVFVGGDGTARDVCRAVGQSTPVIGVPAGVKMQSGVFALVPETAAEVIKAMASVDLVDVGLQEVRDIDEIAFQQGVVKSRYFGEMRVPEIGQFIQATKQGGREVEALVLADIAAYLAELLEEGTRYIVGPGTTPRALMEHLGLPNTLLGMDLIENGQLLAADLSGPELERWVLGSSVRVLAILSVTGKQGGLLGRGNQQLTPAVLAHLGKDNLLVLATKTKIAELNHKPLLIDTNDAQLDQLFSGYYRVITGYQDEVLYPASCFYPAGGGEAC